MSPGWLQVWVPLVNEVCLPVRCLQIKHQAITSLVFPAGSWTCHASRDRFELDELCDGKQSAGANGIDGLMAVVSIHFFHDAAKVILHREL